MCPHSFVTFNPANRRLLLWLAAGHLLWGGAVFALGQAGRPLGGAWWSAGFVALQLYGAAQLLLPVLRLHPEARSRGFYLFWGATLALAVWLANQPASGGGGEPLLAALRSSLLLLAATLVGAALARYVRRLWEVLPVCAVMALADLASWRHGPTAAFSREIERYYLAPEGPPPLVDMLLVKLALPGHGAPAPVFGVSDWIMVVFFACVARRHGIDDNLLARGARAGRYLPVPVAALLGAVVAAQASGLFLPALPLLALVMLLWYALRRRTARPLS